MPDNAVHHQMIAALQGFARAIIPLKPGQQFLIYWTELVRRAGVDLDSKAALDQEQNWDSHPGKVQAAQVAVSEDLTFEEIMAVAVYLQDRYADLLNKWDSYIQTQQQQRYEETPV